MTYDLAAIIAEERGKRSSVTITAGKEMFEIPPPLFWPDDVFVLGDQAGARLLLGERYEAFVEAGGTAALLWEILRRANGADRPE